MTTSGSLQYELEGRFQGATSDVQKVHLSVRWEPAPAIVRVGACIEPYNWDSRMAAIDVLISFEEDHKDEFAVEFDVIPLTSVNNQDFAEA